MRNNAATFKRAQAAYDAQEDPRYWELEQPEPPTPQAQIEALEDTVAEQYKAIAALKAELREKQAALDKTRMRVAAALGERLKIVEARPCTCGMNRCARCEQGAWLRGLLGLPPEPDTSLAPEKP